MKIIKGKAAFEPVTITLESQEELDIFTEVFYRVGGQKMTEVFDSAGHVYALFEQAGGVTKEYSETYGSINVV